MQSSMLASIGSTCNLCHNMREVSRIGADEIPTVLKFGVFIYLCPETNDGAEAILGIERGPRPSTSIIFQDF